MDRWTSYLGRMTFIPLCVHRTAVIGTIPNEPILSEGTRTPLRFILVVGRKYDFLGLYGSCA